MTKKPLTASYIFFYVLFSEDTWRVLIAIAFTALVAPSIQHPEITIAGYILLYVMIATIGYAFGGMPARLITRAFKKMVLGDRVP